jgi:D-arabinose 1-dehydrogenase-like Zn-dependent alcohol dehydrogenase
MTETDPAPGMPLQRSLRLTAFGAALQPGSNPAPVPAGSELLLRVSACGVCHSDLHLADGYFDLGNGQRLDIARSTPLPLTLGHEIAGDVVAVGPATDPSLVGQRRVVYPWIGCGECALCQRGAEHLCNKPRALGINRAGGYSNYVLVPHARYLFDFSPLHDAFAATLACSGLTAFSALRKAAPISAEEPLLIVGAGGVGQAGLAIAKAVFGVAPVVADIDPAKRAAALAAGAGEALDPADAESRKRLMKQTGGGFAAAIDFVGATASIELAMAMVRKGGKVIVVGLFGGSTTIAIPTLPLRAISIAGSMVGSLAEMAELMQIARRGAIQPLPIEHRALEEAEAVLQDLRAGRIRGRAVLAP